jgi:hypothetical protein
MFSPRALLGAAPAVIVLAGSFVLSRQCQPDSGRADAHGAVASRACAETVLPVTPEDEDRLHRVAIKEETVDDLLDGRLSVEDAVDRFEMLVGSAGPGNRFQGSTTTERAVYQVISYARVRCEQEHSRYAAAMARVEAEAEAILARTRQTH